MKVLNACCVLCLLCLLYGDGIGNGFQATQGEGAGIQSEEGVASSSQADTTQPYVDLGIGGMEILIDGKFVPFGNNKVYPWDDLAGVPMYWVHQNKAIRSLYEKTDEWTVDSFVFQKWLYPSTRTECGYPMYGYTGKHDSINRLRVLDRRGNVSFVPNISANDMLTYVCPTGLIFSWVDRQKKMFEIYNYEKHGVWKEIPLRDTLTYIQPTESGLVYIREFVEGGSGYYGNMNAADPYQAIRSLDHRLDLQFMRFTTDMSRMVCEVYQDEYGDYSNEDNPLLQGHGIAFFDSQYQLVRHYLGAYNLYAISPDNQRCVFQMNEDTCLTDMDGNFIRRYEGLSIYDLVWSPSGDSFWMDGYIVNARNGEIIGKVRDSPYTCGALSDMDSHRIAFADGNMLHVIDYETREKLLFIDNKEISYDTTVVTLSGDGRECTAYMTLRSTPDHLGTVIQRYREIGVSHE